MQTGDNKLFGIHAQAMMLRSYRSEIIASNMANANTPNFKSQDVAFSSILERTNNENKTSDTTNLVVTNVNHIGKSIGDNDISDKDLYFREPTQPSLDGNTVNTQDENGQFLDNAIHYQASVTFLNGRISSILSAIRGQ